MLLVSPSDASEINDPDFWPTGIYVRRWGDDCERRKPQNEQISGPTSGSNENTDAGTINGEDQSSGYFHLHLTTIDI